MPSLNYKHLRYFWMVAKAGSIARASEQLHLTPQSISGQLGEFEAALGVELFRRVGRVNEAEQYAHEELELTGTARAMQRVAWIKIVKGQTDAARIYLNVLRDDLVCGRWAADCLQRLQADASLRSRLGQAAREKVRRAHTWTAVVDQVLRLAGVDRAAQTPGAAAR